MYFIIGTIIVLGLFLPAPITASKMRWNAYKGTHRIINATVWFTTQALAQVISMWLVVRIFTIGDDADFGFIAVVGMLGVLGVGFVLPFACFHMLEHYRKVQVTVTR